MTVTIESPEDYHADTQCVSKSMLTVFDEPETGPQDYYERFVAKTKQSPPRSREMEIGTKAHLAILEPERFAAEYEVAPLWTRPKKRLLEAYRKECPPGKTILDVDESRKLERMLEAAREVAGQLLDAPGRVEVSIRGRCPITGLWLKCRPDKWFVQGNAILDLKGTGTMDRFWWVFKHFKYAMQDVHYSSLIELETGVLPSFHFLAVEYNKPYRAKLFTLPPAKREIARRRWIETKKRLARCYQTGDWSGKSAAVTEPCETFF